MIVRKILFFVIASISFIQGMQKDAPKKSDELLMEASHLWQINAVPECVEKLKEIIAIGTEPFISLAKIGIEIAKPDQTAENMLLLLEKTIQVLTKADKHTFLEAYFLLGQAIFDKRYYEEDEVKRDLLVDQAFAFWRDGVQRGCIECKLKILEVLITHDIDMENFAELEKNVQSITVLLDSLRESSEKEIDLRKKHKLQICYLKWIRIISPLNLTALEKIALHRSKK